MDGRWKMSLPYYNTNNIMTTQTEIAVVIEQTGLEKQTGDRIQMQFQPLFEKAKEWREKAEAIVVTDVSQKHEMKMAREARLALKEIRVNADKTRKALKEDSLRYGKAVQGVYNVIEYLIVPIEKHLEEQEKFVERKEAERKAAVKASREMDLQPFAEFVPIGIDLANMLEEDFEKLLTGARLQQEQKIAAEKKAEEERIAKEKAEAEERERVRLENEKLRKEAEEREKALAAERAEREQERKEAEEKLRKEAEEKAQLEEELKAKKEEEERQRREELARVETERLAKEEAERKAQAAPDREKLLVWVEALRAVPTPTVTTKEAKEIVKDSHTWLLETINHIKAEAEQL